MSTPPEVDQDQNMFYDTNGPILSIPEFYIDRSVFITGGTGFMGKVNSLQFRFLLVNRLGSFAEIDGRATNTKCNKCDVH